MAAVLITVILLIFGFIGFALCTKNEPVKESVLDENGQMDV